jgi:hypothetical protein
MYNETFICNVGAAATKHNIEMIVHIPILYKKKVAIHRKIFLPRSFVYCER